MSPRPKLHLIGIRPDPRWLPPAVLDLIEEAEVLAGGRRLVDLFPDFQGELLYLNTPLTQWLETLARRSEDRQVVVLASGDPNFFGLAQKLLTVAPPERVAVIPGPTTIQEAFARLKITWEGVETVSLHGRAALAPFWAALYRAGISGAGRLAVYTDPQFTPSALAAKLIERGQTNWRMMVFEDLGQAEEKVSSWSLDEAASKKFSELNLVVLERLAPGPPIFPGRDEADYAHQAGLITKSEVRAVALSLLELAPAQVMWDLGAGSGSVSVEAAMFLTRGEIWAVEKSPERLVRMAENRSRFGAAQVELVAGQAPEVYGLLPDPDRIFIGGGGESLDLMIRLAKPRLKPGGVMVVSLVSLDNLVTALHTMREAGLDPAVTQVSAARSSPLAGSVQLKPINQVWLLKGRRPPTGGVTPAEFI